MSDLVLDGSTPAAVKSAAGTKTTASFSPPANAVAVALLACDDGEEAGHGTISNTGTTLTWTERINRQESVFPSEWGRVTVWTAPTGGSAPGAITVSAVQPGAYQGALWVRVYTAGDQATLTGITGGASITAATIQVSLTPQTSTSELLAVLADMSGSAYTPTPVAGASLVDSYAPDGTMALFRRDGTTGVAVNLGCTNSSGVQGNIVGIELRASGVAPPPTIPRTTLQSSRRLG